MSAGEDELELTVDRGDAIGQALPDLHRGVSAQLLQRDVAQISGCDPVARQEVVHAVAGGVAAGSTIDHQRLPACPAEGERCAQPGRSGTDDDEVAQEPGSRLIG